MTFLWITLLLILSSISQVSSSTLATVEPPVISTNHEDIPNSVRAKDFSIFTTQNTAASAYPLHSSTDLNEETTAVDSTHTVLTSTGNTSTETANNTVTKVLKILTHNIATWRSTASTSFGDTMVSTRENIINTTLDQGTTKPIDMVEDTTTLDIGSSETTGSPSVTATLVQEPITSSGTDLSHTGKGNASTASEIAMTPRTGSQPEKPPTHSILGQCLIAIFILALVATLFIVCTIVLTAKLTSAQKDYKVHQQHSTEMICISSLLPDNEPEADRSKVKPKRMKTFAGNVDDSEDDNMTLNSFLPDH
ncbi:P-selectin glycoprotein ligand 1 [Rhinatrema bivittatum]|uniref:P-selectin glycoprotein ligand 1 n=1 Tax=Rhinatrema bivittatum TaxID=194408 RepID=UPI0011272C95|nr:P-selectin glycoprotein ligand 1 [Rhinatrema bivittatum]